MGWRLVRRIPGNARSGCPQRPTLKPLSSDCCPGMSTSSVPRLGCCCSTPPRRKASPRCRPRSCTTWGFLWPRPTPARCPLHLGWRPRAVAWACRALPRWTTSGQPWAVTTRLCSFRRASASMRPRKVGLCWPAATWTRFGRWATSSLSWPTRSKRSCPAQPIWGRPWCGPWAEPARRTPFRPQKWGWKWPLRCSTSRPCCKTWTPTSLCWPTG